MEQNLVNFENVYFKLKEEFQKIIIDDFEIKQKLFDITLPKEGRKTLSSNYIKPLPHTKGAKPEAITTQFIKKLLNQIGIKDELIVPEVRLKITQAFQNKSINRYPDLAIINKAFKKDTNKSLLFEIEALNKDLQNQNEKIGINQALEWFQKSIGLYRDYNAIITNFNEWYLLSFDKNEDLIIKPMSPIEILKIIRDIALSEHEFDLDFPEGEIISKNFFLEFSKRLKMLISPNETIKIVGLNQIASNDENTLYQEKINYYRTFFHRLLFIKILLDWKLLKFDPIQEIINQEEKRNIFNNVRDLFFKILNSDKDRIDILPKFKDLPFLNGGLFRLTELEEKYPTVALNADAIIDIWNLLRTYNFTLQHEIKKKINSNNIDPNILGYIFEKSIGDFRKSSGAYYTSSIITDYISKNVLFRYIFDEINKKFPNYAIHSLNQILIYHQKTQYEISDFVIETLKNLKICDPFVGSGAFLVSIGELIVSIYKFIYENIRTWNLFYKENSTIENDPRPFKDLYSMKMYIIQNNLYGIDINISAIDICQMRLWLWLIQPPSHLDIFILILSPLPNIEYNIKQGNSFIGYTKDITDIDILDKTTGKNIKYTSILEWADVKKYSLTQMLKERNQMIKEYYEEINSDRRNTLKAQIKNLTNEYNENFDNLLLYDYKNKEIVSKKIKIKPEQFKNENLDDIFSITLVLNEKAKLTISEALKKKILIDNKGNLIKGIKIGKSSLVIQYRVFEPHKKDKFLPQKPLEIYEKIIELIKIESVKEIVVQHFINKETLQILKRFHWSMEFSDFFKSNGFDLIITNPPYGNILSQIEKDILSLTDDITEDIYINFLEKLSRKEIPFKYAGILCPKSYLLRQKYLEFRNAFLNNINVYEISNIGSGQFQGATNEVQIIFCNSNKNYSNSLDIKDFLNNNVVISYNNKSEENKPWIDDLSVCRNNKCKINDTISSFYGYFYDKNCPICHEPTIPLNRIRIQLTPKEFQLINKIERNSNLNYLNPLDYPKMKRGEEDKGLNSIKEILKNDLTQSCVFINAKDDFQYYYIKKDKSFDIENIDSNILKGEDYEFYFKPKLLIKHNNIVPEAIYSEEKICFTSSVYSLLNDDLIELKYLSAIINSAVVQFYCLYGINNQRDTTINLNQYMIRHLPIFNAEKSIKTKIALKVDEIVNILKKNNNKIDTIIQSLLIEVNDIIFNLYSIDNEERQSILLDLRDNINFFKNIYI